jgi:murein DD-endopeptidase MepM/ murein hydrolase activator NlpD
MLGVLLAWLVFSVDARDECFSLPFDNPNLDYAWGTPRRGGGAHRGLDFPQPKGTPIPVVADGVVVLKTTTDCLGHVVVIEHTNGVFSAYAHMKRASPLREGSRVERGDIVGVVGSTGSCATGAHLHLTIAPTKEGFTRGETFDPLIFIRARQSQTGLCTH